MKWETSDHYLTQRDYTTEYQTELVVTTVCNSTPVVLHSLNQSVVLCIVIQYNHITLLYMSKPNLGSAIANRGSVRVRHWVSLSSSRWVCCLCASRIVCMLQNCTQYMNTLLLQQMASNTAILGGYDCKFVETPPDKLMCQICQAVARSPHQVTCCGRVYCKACLDEHKKRSKTCPNCRQMGQSFPDIRGEWISDISHMGSLYSAITLQWLYLPTLLWFCIPCKDSY